MLIQFLLFNLYKHLHIILLSIIGFFPTRMLGVIRLFLLAPFRGFLPVALIRGAAVSAVPGEVALRLDRCDLLLVGAAIVGTAICLVLLSGWVVFA